jgi:hypothetical protein
VSKACVSAAGLVGRKLVGASALVRIVVANGTVEGKVVVTIGLR